MNDLLQKGVLVQYADDEGSYVQFRYRCLQEYFTARYLQDNPGTLAQLFEADGFVESVREIDILTGLTRNNPKIVEALIHRLTEMMTVASAADATERMREFNALKLDYVKADAASLALAEEVHEAEATDEEINALLDTSDEPDNDRGSTSDKTNLDSPGLKFFLTTFIPVESH